MQYIGNLIMYLIMGCLALGCIGAIRHPDSGIGYEFCEGIRQLGVIFIPIAGVMTLLPYIQIGIEKLFNGISNVIGCDTAIWAGMILPPDMGGNLAAYELAGSAESWIIALLTAFILGSGVTFGIPLCMEMVEEKDYPYLAQGILCGIMACPFGITVSCFLAMLTKPEIRTTISTVSDSFQILQLTLGQILHNLLPVYVICLVISVGMIVIPRKMIKGFIAFGKALNQILYLAFALAVIEYFTGVFSHLIPGWRFSPIVADSVDYNRALEIAGYCALMLGGAYPMLYLLRKYLGKGIEELGRKLHISPEGCLGILASSVTLVAMFRIYKEMPPEDKIRSSAWVICAGYILADHLVYCYNFQPSLYGCLLGGKLAGGFIAMIFVSVITKRNRKEAQ